MERTIEINVNDEYLKNLKRQKRMILLLVATGLMPEEFEIESEGILGMMDEIQDKAVDEGFHEDEVFDLTRNHPEEEEGHTREFNAETEAFKKEIMHCAEIVQHNG